MQKILLSILCVFLLSVSFSAETVITINSTTISETCFNSLFDQFMNNYKSYLSFRSDELDQKEINEIKQAVLEELLEEAITKKYAQENNIVVSEAEIQQKVNEIKKGFPDDKTFWKILKDQKTSFDELVESLKAELLKEKIIEHVSPTEEIITTMDIVRHFQKNTLGSPSIEYTLTLLVTSNQKYLTALINNPNLNWEKANIDKHLSLYNETLVQKDLSEKLSETLSELDCGVYSEVAQLNEDNFFSVKVHSVRIDMNAVPEQIRSTILKEKKNNAYKDWLIAILATTEITLNPKIFPSSEFNFLSLATNNVLEEQEEIILEPKENL